MAEKFASLEASRAALAAENAALKNYRLQTQGAAMMEALDAFYDQEGVPEQGMMAAFEILFCKQPETPATDAFLREIRAQGVEEFADSKYCQEESQSGAYEFAAELRQGGAA